MALRHRVHSALWRLGCRPTASHRDRGHRSTAQDYERAIAAAKTQEKWLERVRNFSIVAHIDHGKSTLADRLLEFTGFERKNVAQVLDSLEVERERGITIKAQTATLLYFPKDQDGKEQEIPYILNLIDTPGHVDFSFEVNRSVYACDGGLLLVDSSQGIEAQTIANYRFAKDAGLKMVPVLTKLDLPHAHPEQIKEQLLLVFDIDPDEVLETSAKRNTGIESVLEAIVKRMPHPFARAENLNSVELSGKRLKAQILDSWYDIHRGAICLVKIVEGTLSKGQHIHCFGSGRSYEVQEVGILTPVPVNISCIPAGQVGYMIAGMKTSKEVLLGDTFYDGPQEYSASNILPGFQKTHSMVFASIFPCAKESFGALKEAVEKLTLNDASVEVHLEDSDALGSGFTCGFNGVLHMEVFCERLTSEHAMDVIITSPTVPYRVHWKKECRPEGIPDGQDYTTIKSPSEFPDLFKVKK